MAYASKYYDPVKAHEYYEAHKQLKGRQSKTSTEGLSKEGKSVAAEVKRNIQKERKEAVSQLRETVKTEISQHNERMKEKIADMRERFNSLSRADKKVNREPYLAELNRLREEHKVFKEQIRADLTKEIENWKTRAEETYISELGNIRKDKSLIKVTKK